MRIVVATIMLLFGVGVALAGCATQKSVKTMAEATETTAIIDGGRIYDNWMAELGSEKPKATHSLWPASNTKKKGATTWRCKSCHGWDYMGKDGAYASGSYKTGITGIRASDGADPASVVALLRGPSHGFTSAMISDEAIEKIALFVTKGQIDLDKYIDRSTKKAKGNPANGKVYYDNTCARCHGNDGKEINFKTADKPEYLGTLANGNPWEGINKILHGQPDSEMTAHGMMPTQVLTDILAYTQTLPTK